MAAYVPHPFHGNPKAYLWNELNRIAVAISGGGITNLSPASSAVVLTPNPILGAGTIGVSANLNAYSGGDTPSAFTLGIVDSVDAAAWRAAIGAGTSSAAGANPSASVGLTVVNGAATTFLRSDGAPPLSQSITPVWTGDHRFEGTVGYSVASDYATLGKIGSSARLGLVRNSSTANSRIWELVHLGGTNSLQIRALNDAASSAKVALAMYRNASSEVITALEYGNSTDNPTHTFYGGVTSRGGGLPTTDTGSSYCSIGTLGSSTYPALIQFAGGAPANNRRWYLYVDETGGNWNLALADDAGSVAAIGLGFISSGGVITEARTNGTLITQGSQAARAGLQLPHGTAPSSPVNGDMWTTTAGLYIRINGVTIGPLTVTPSTAYPDPQHTFTEYNDFVTPDSAGFTYSSGTTNTSNSSAGHPGVVNTTSGAATTGSFGWSKANTFSTTQSPFMVVGGGEITFEALIEIPTLWAGGDTGQIRIGFMDEFSGAPSNGIHLQYESGNTKWGIYTRNAGASQSAFGTTNVATGWHHIKIVINAGGTSADLYVDGVNECTVASGFPTAAFTFGGQVQKTAGTTPAILRTDFYKVVQTFTSARW